MVFQGMQIPYEYKATVLTPK